MKQITTAPPPRPWSRTEGYVEPSRDESRTINENSSPTSAGHANGYSFHGRRASTDSNDDNAAVGIDPNRIPEPVQIARTTDFMWQNLNMGKQELCTFALKLVLSNLAPGCVRW
jgi:hypothetical protein